RSRRCSVMLLALLLTALTGACSPKLIDESAGVPGTGEARRDLDWNAAFTRSAGWNGGDVAHSIDLRDGRTLWLFGDSLVGPVRAGARIGDESKFVRSAIAWHTSPPAAGAPPTDLAFATGEPAPDVHHAKWITPAPGLWPDDAWYWLMGDGLRID